MRLGIALRLLTWRFTPTCVGNARSAPLERVWCSVHPHVCGECAMSSSVVDANGGSPPCVWGMLHTGREGRRGERFTPTCVGNARGSSCSRHRGSVHPHVCGECVRKREGKVKARGSPPRVWGMRQLRRVRRQRQRFTPTCVGNAIPLMWAFHFATVHPHVCGECSLKGVERAVLLGSPPRVWGMHDLGEELVAPARFTPTCVGNAEGHPKSERGRSVHPHVCGECATPSWSAAQMNGSPPRVWGMLPE